MPTVSSRHRRNPADHVTELKELVVGYAKQETVDPLRNLGRYVGFGLAGSLFVGLGSIFLLLGAMRGLQHLEVFDGGGAGSLVPYAVALLGGVLIIGLAVVRITKAPERAGGGPR